VLRKFEHAPDISTCYSPCSGTQTSTKHKTGMNDLRKNSDKLSILSSCLIGVIRSEPSDEVGETSLVKTTCLSRQRAAETSDHSLLTLGNVVWKFHVRRYFFKDFMTTCWALSWQAP